MFSVNNSILVVVDVQGKLFQVMHEKEFLLKNLLNLIQGVKVLGIPVVLTEQNPQRMGVTVAQIKELLNEANAIPKLTFSCCANEGFMDVLKPLNRRQVLLCGMETHICIYQTALELKVCGYEVEVVSDAVSSRTAENKEVGLEKLKAAGIGVTSVETALFELLRTAQGDSFKEILKIIK